ncbi:MAG: hypothetical protein AB4042_00025 [Leptolyngbyaceae cyanobacterium]
MLTIKDWRIRWLIEDFVIYLDYHATIPVDPCVGEGIFVQLNIQT